MGRTFEEEKAFVWREDEQKFRIDAGFVPNMRVSVVLVGKYPTCLIYLFSTHAVVCLTVCDATVVLQAFVGYAEKGPQVASGVVAGRDW